METVADLEESLPGRRAPQGRQSRSPSLPQSKPETTDVAHFQRRLTRYPLQSSCQHPSHRDQCGRKGRQFDGLELNRVTTIKTQWQRRARRSRDAQTATATVMLYTDQLAGTGAPQRSNARMARISVKSADNNYYRGKRATSPIQPPSLRTAVQPQSLMMTDDLQNTPARGLARRAAIPWATATTRTERSVKSGLSQRIAGCTAYLLDR